MGAREQPHYEVRLTGDDWWQLHQATREQLAEHARLGGGYDTEYYEMLGYLSRLLLAVAEAKRVGE